MNVLRRGANAIPVLVLNHANFPDKKFYDAKRYIHVTQEGTEDSLFLLSKDSIPSTGAVGIGDLELGINDHTDYEEANGATNLLSVCSSNLCS